MKYLKLLILSTVLTFSTTAFSDQIEDIECICNEQVENPIPLNSNILLIGDSHVGGLSYQFKKTSKVYEYKPIVDSIIGSQTSSLKKRLSEDIEKYNPKLIIIVSGTNDAVMDPSRISKDLYKEVFDLAKSKGAQVVWVSPPSDSEKLISLREVDEAIREAAKSDYFPSESFDLKVSKDKIHLTQSGYNSWMEYIWACLIDKGLIIEGC